MYRLFIIIGMFSFFCTGIIAQKEYHREYYTDGTMKAEGWKIGSVKTAYWYQYYRNGEIAEQGQYKNNKKVGYWYFYSKNKVLSKEGHFKDNKAESWWIIYDIATQKNDSQITRKYQGNKKIGIVFYIKTISFLKQKNI